MKTINMEHEYGTTIKMEQAHNGAKVKITIHYASGNGRGYDVVWADKNAANKFYQTKLADGFKVV